MPCEALTEPRSGALIGAYAHPLVFPSRCFGVLQGFTAGQAIPEGVVHGHKLGLILGDDLLMEALDASMFRLDPLCELLETRQLVVYQPQMTSDLLTYLPKDF